MLELEAAPGGIGADRSTGGVGFDGRFDGRFDEWLLDRLRVGDEPCVDGRILDRFVRGDDRCVAAGRR